MLWIPGVCPRYPRPRPFDRLKDLPPEFVELVETNPDVTLAFASHPFDH